MYDILCPSDVSKMSMRKCCLIIFKFTNSFVQVTSVMYLILNFFDHLLGSSHRKAYSVDISKIYAYYLELLIEW